MQTRMRLGAVVLLMLSSVLVVSCGGAGTSGDGGVDAAANEGGDGGADGGSDGGGVAISATANTAAQHLVVNVPMASFAPLSASGGVTPYTYSYTGTLPTGLNFSASTGAVSGTPTVVYATASLVFSVKDANDVVANTTSTVSFTVSASGVFGTKQLGVAAATTYGRAVATDANGNVYVAGDTSGDLDGNTKTGMSDFFVTKYSAGGVKLFTRQLGVAAATTQGRAVATDGGGNVYVAGFSGGGLDGNTLTGTFDLFVTKFDGSGVKQYTKQLGVAGANTSGTSVAVDASGNVYVAGTTTGGLDGNTLAGARDCFVTKYNSGGVKQYTMQLGVAGGAQWTDGNSVATDVSGNVYVAGDTTGDLDGNTLTGAYDFFVTKYNSGGAKQYTKQLGVASASTLGLSVATDASGNVYVAGYTEGGLDGNTLTGTRDFFVSKYNSSGTKQYSRQLGVAAKLADGRSVATDASGNVYVAGYTFGGLDGNTLAGSSDFFVTKYSGSGVKQFTRQLGVAAATTHGYSVATDASGNVFVAGDTTGGLDGNTVAGTYDFFLTRYDSNGVK